MRDVLDAIDGLRVPWFVTGSGASVYGVLRASQDVDVVLDAAGFGALADASSPATRSPTHRFL
jgi:hypothetical protein